MTVRESLELLGVGSTLKREPQFDIASIPEPTEEDGIEVRILSGLRP
jgi:hypothetical protein